MFPTELFMSKSVVHSNKNGELGVKAVYLYVICDAD